jgi:urease accessory protein
MTASIVTHSGSFHADESLAVYMLRLLPEYKDAEIIRTRDPSIIASGTIVVDVGAEYLPEALRFDHHQRGFTETFSPQHSIKLSSAGLVYKHFGRQVLEQILGNHSQMDLIHLKIYNDFIEAV